MQPMEKKRQFKVRRKPVAGDVDPCKPLTLGLALQKSLVSPKLSKSQSDEIVGEFRKQFNRELSSVSQAIVSHSYDERMITSHTTGQTDFDEFSMPFPSNSKTSQLSPPVKIHDLSNMAYSPPATESSSFLSAADSTISTVSPPSLGPLLRLRVDCSLCRDKDMLRLNATELRCGHFVHGSCLRECSRRTMAAPICRTCGSVCERISFGNSRHSSSIYSSFTPDSLAADGEDLVSPNCDVEPLMIRAYAHPTGSGSCELIVQVSASKGALKSYWKNYRSTKQELLVKKLATDAIGVTQLAGQPINHQAAGPLRIVSKFWYHRHRVVAYLFARYIIILQHSEDGFEDLLAVVDLESEHTEIYQGQDGSLILATPDASYELAADRLTISTWLSAVNDLTLLFPVVDTKNEPAQQQQQQQQQQQLDLPLNPGYVESGTLDFVVCMPIKHLERVVPLMLAQLGPQDRLGLVVVSIDGASAWLHPHKPSWSGWDKISPFDSDSCSLFTAASRDILSTAVSLFSGHTNTGRQQSVAVVSGCPLASTSIPDTITVHTIGYGELFDLELMTRLARSSRNGKFYYAESRAEVDSCLVGLVSADRTYVHHHIQLKVNLREGATITGTVGQSDFKSHQPLSSIELSLGSMMSGQSRTVLLEVSSGDIGPAVALGECSIESKSALTGSSHYRQCIARVGMGQVPDFIFFDRLTRVSAEIVREGLKLAISNDAEGLFAILGRTAAKIEASARARPLNAVPKSKLMQLSNAHEDAEIMTMKARLLAFGLRELQLKCPQIGVIPASVKAMLYETAITLELQCSVTSRSGIDRVFFERLDSNRL